MIVAMIALGAILGAPARYLADRGIQRRHQRAFPWGTLAVNVVASLVLGVAAGAGDHWDPWLTALVGTGFCGTLSTYSTFGFETMRLNATGHRAYAITNVALSLIAGVGAAALGWAIGSAVT